MKRPPLAWWALLVGGVALIAAIWFWYDPGNSSEDSSDASPEPTATAQSSPRPGASPAPPRPEMPAAAKQQTKEGAEAFVRYYLDAEYYAMATNDYDFLAGLYGKDCEYCNMQLDALKDRISEGQHLAGGQYAVLSARVVFEGGRYTVYAKIKGAELQVVNEDGSPVSPQEEAYEGRAVVQIQWEGWSWRVYGCEAA